MMSNKVLIHILEDNPLVTFLLERTIRNNFDSKIKCFTSSHEFEHSLNTQKPDLLILDYYLGPLKNQETVLPTIEKLKKKSPENVYCFMLIKHFNHQLFQFHLVLSTLFQQLV